MVAHARIELGRARRTVIVPAQAVQLARDGSRYLWVVAAGKAERRDVAIGLRGLEVTEVLSGVKQGEQIVLRGQEKLRPGLAVQLVGGLGPAVSPPSATTRASQE